jgi:Zn-dependent peptidase ImmA (M78 family)
MTKKERAQAHRYGQTLFELFLRVRELAGVKPTEITIPNAAGESPRRAAGLTRSALGLAPDTPIQNLTNSVERAGVVVLALPVNLDGRDAFSVWVEGVPVIAISDGLPGDRIRYSIAHELGHLVMHRASKGLIKQLEDEANAYASELLVPYEAFLALAQDGVSLTFLGDQKKLWGVSVQTLARRSRDMGELTERQYHAVFEQLARLGIPRKQESDFVPIPREKPRALRQMIERRYGIPINLQRLSKDVHMTPLRLENILMVNAESAKPNQKVLPMRRRPAR